MMKKIFYKLTSLVLVLSMLLTFTAVVALAQENEGEKKDSLEIFYNRNFEEGWNYTNGMSTDLKMEIDSYLSYKKISATWYNYWLEISPYGDRGGYLGITLGDDAPTSGNLFIEFDILSHVANNNIGGVVMTKTLGDDPSLNHIVSMREGGLYLLGEWVEAVPTEWSTISFAFDLDYAAENETEGKYLVTAYLDGTAVAERVYSSDEIGISDVYFGAQENFLAADRDGHGYAIDNVKIYSGVEDFCDMPENKYGSAVNKSLARDFTVLGGGTSSGAYLTGQPDIDRIDASKVTEGITIYYNRHFSDGWDYDIGFSTATERQNEFSLAQDYSSEVNKGESGFVNYYWQFVQRNTQNGFISLETNNYVKRGEGKVYFEFDIKANAGATIPGMIAYLNPGTPRVQFNIVTLSNGDLYVLEQNVGKLGEEWCHITYEMDFDWGPEHGDPSAIKFTAWIGGSTMKIELFKYIDRDATDSTSFRGLHSLRIGRGGSTLVDGDWYALDNIQLYSAPSPATLPTDQYGLMVNTQLPKDFVIDTGVNTAPNVTEMLEMSLSMKVGSNNALLRGEKIQLFTDTDGNAYGAPIKLDGKVLVPLDPILQYVDVPYRYHSDNLACEFFINGQYRSLAVDRQYLMVDGSSIKLTASPVLKNVNGNPVTYIALDDVETIFPGTYVTYDEVGFISIAPYDDYLTRDLHEDFMRDAMKRFVYDQIDPSEVYDLVVENSNNFDHPYIYATQDRYDELYEAYHLTEEDENYDYDLWKLIHEAVKYADKYMAKYCNLDENGNYVGLKEGQWKYNNEGMASWDTTQPEGNYSVSEAPYPDTAGYDPSGSRLNVVSDGEGCLSIASEAVAYAYQMTRDPKYAIFAYEWSYALCQWKHWGPGHYLNVGTTARNIGMAYDMLYDAWIELGLNPAPIRDELYRLCTYTTYRSLSGLPTEYLNINGTESGYWWNHIGNWNSVCASGVLVTSLLALENPQYVENASFVLAKSIYYLGYNGFNYFNFDGSYRESSGYWCATIRFSQYCILTVQNAFGTDFGLGEAPGIDISNYFGSHAQSNDYLSWNYHDDWESNLASFWYFMAAEMFDNPEFAAIRYMHLQNGKTSYRWDSLWYDRETIEAGQVSLDLDYVMGSIDAIMTRSSWEPGTLYAGLMGGPNKVAHGQYDAGNWIYENAGIRWFFDLGADDYNLYGGGLTMGYYRYATEGNNVIGMASQQDLIPQGQQLMATADLISSVTNEYGSAAILDMRDVYGGPALVSYAYRGMLLTNDRKTVIIQDEVNLVQAQTMYWSAHYKNTVVTDVSLSSNGRTAYMKAMNKNNGTVYTLRVSLLTPNRLLKFEIWDAYTFYLDATPRPGYSMEMKGIDEDSRNHINKLVIKLENLVKYEIAVAIELIDEDNPVDVGYELGWDGNPAALPPMSSWIPGPDTRVVNDPTEDGEAQTAPSIYSLISNSDNITQYINSGDYLGADRSAFFRVLSEIEHTLLYYGREHSSTEVMEAISVYDSAREKYDKYRTKATADGNTARSIVKNMIGLPE